MKTLSYENIQLDKRGAVATITLNRPPLNILDRAMIEEILDAFGAIEASPELRIIVFRAAGEKAFCAGVSIQDHTPDKIGQMIPRFHEIFRQLARTDKVIVAAVQGHCLGGGMELVTMCDLVIASENAQFSQPEIKLGQLPPVGIVLLPYLIGYRKAADLLLRGATIGARQAESLGLVNRVVAPEQLAKSLDEMLAELTALSGSALALTKQLLGRVSGLEFERLLNESEEFFLKQVAPTDDGKEGVFAFLEKRAPRWTHRR